MALWIDDAATADDDDDDDDDGKRSLSRLPQKWNESLASFCYFLSFTFFSPLPLLSYSSHFAAASDCGNIQIKIEGFESVQMNLCVLLVLLLLSNFRPRSCDCDSTAIGNSYPHSHVICA